MNIHKMLLYDTSVLYCYEASLHYQVIYPKALAQHGFDSHLTIFPQFEINIFKYKPLSRIPSNDLQNFKGQLVILGEALFVNVYMYCSTASTIEESNMYDSQQVESIYLEN